MANIILRTIWKLIPKRAQNAFIRSFLGHILLDQPKSNIKILIRFLFSRKIKLSLIKRIEILEEFNKIRKRIHCLHSFDEILIPTYVVLSTPSTVRGCILEAGAYRGGSTAKLSIIAKLTGRKLFVFDSFKGLPHNEEPIAHTKCGYSCNFDEGDYAASLSEVKKNVKKFGSLDVCIFVEGWFEDTMPIFKEDILLVFCDVDLESSNKTCLKYLWPRLVKGGYFFSQDAHIPIVDELFHNKTFWKKEVSLNNAPKFYRITPRFGYFKKGTNF